MISQIFLFRGIVLGHSAGGQHKSTQPMMPRSMNCYGFSRQNLESQYNLLADDSEFIAFDSLREAKLRQKHTQGRRHFVGAAGWNQFRLQHPELELRPCEGDDLSFLMSFGNADPVLSRETYLAVRVRLATSNFLGAAKQLVKLRRRSVFTFHASGWVRKAVALIVLEDEKASKEFVKSYWSKDRKRTPLGAYEALSLIQGPHLAHWLRAVRWFLRFHRSYDPRKKEERFVAEAVLKYIQERTICNSCLHGEALVVIAEEVFANPQQKPHVLKDLALARFKGITPSALVRLRASL